LNLKNDNGRITAAAAIRTVSVNIKYQADPGIGSVVSPATLKRVIPEEETFYNIDSIKFFLQKGLQLFIRRRSGLIKTDEANIKQASNEIEIDDRTVVFFGIV